MRIQKLNHLLKDPNTNWKYILIVAILAFLVGAGILGYYYWWMPRQEVEMPEIEMPEREVPEEVEVPADWKTYRNEEYGFEIKYPPNLIAKDWAFETPNWHLLVYFGENKDIGDGPVFIGVEKGVNTLEQKSFFPFAVQIKDLEDVLIGEGNYKAKKFSYKGPAPEMPGESDFVKYFIEYSGYLYQIHYDKTLKSFVAENTFNQMLLTFRFEEPVVQKCSDGTPNRQCSITKPSYCQNFKLVNACMTCGCPEGMMCQQDNTCIKVDLGKKVYILKNGEPKEKLDLLFIPQNISDFSILRSKINDIFYKSGVDINGVPMVSLFNTEPFKSYKSKFNVAYVDKNIDETLFDCWKEEPDPTKPPKWHLGHGCNENKIKEAYGKFDPDYIVVIFDLPAGYHSQGGEIQYLEINLESSDRFAILSWTFAHEFGHQFGGLADEYVTTGSPSRHCGTAENYECFENYENAVKIYPNLDTLGCPKWCESYDLNKDEILIEENKLCGVAKNKEECTCTWFELKHPFFNTHCIPTQGAKNIGIDCEGDTECVFGGDYGQLAFNPGVGIMGGGTKFNKPSKNHLKSIFECCYPRKETEFCKNFRDKFRNLPGSINPHLRIAYNKIISCQ